MSFSKIGPRVKRSYGTTRKDGSKKPDLTKDPSNPTGALHQHYQRLMAIAELDKLQFETIALIAPLRDNGMSENHWRTFERTVQESLDIEDLQKYLTNFVMTGAGLAVLDTSR